MRVNVEKQKRELKRDRGASPSVQTQAGAVNPASLLGRGRVMPEPVVQKMNDAFGMDFSNVVIYESPIVEEMGAEAASMGGHIAFAPGKYRPDSTAGQALLGHELAHVVQQDKGAATGTGFLNDPALETQADIQGRAAALGQSVSLSGPAPAVPAMSPGTAAPVQAKKPDRKKAAQPRQAAPQAPAPERPAKEVFEENYPNIAQELQARGPNPNIQGGATFHDRFTNTLLAMGWRGRDNSKAQADKAFTKMYGLSDIVKQRLADRGITQESFSRYYNAQRETAGGWGRLTKEEMAGMPEYARDVGTMNDIESEIIGEMLDDSNMQKLLRAKYKGFSGLSQEAREAMGGDYGVLGALLNDIQLRMVGPALATQPGMTLVAQGSMSLDSGTINALLDKAAGRDFNALSDDELAEVAAQINDRETNLKSPSGTKPAVPYTNVARLKQYIGLLNKMRGVVTAPEPEPQPQAPQASPFPTVRTVDDIQFPEGVHSRPAYATMAPPEEVTPQSSYDEALAAIYHRIKNPEPGETPEDISARKRAFAQLRSQQMAEQNRAPAQKKNKKWWQFWK